LSALVMSVYVVALAGAATVLCGGAHAHHVEGDSALGHMAAETGPACPSHAAGSEHGQHHARSSDAATATAWMQCNCGATQTFQGFVGAAGLVSAPSRFVVRMLPTGTPLVVEQELVDAPRQVSPPPPRS
jgi:hypothetical protein